MTGLRQAVFVRQRRIDVIQRALSKILDDESWSPATPRRLHVGAADASSHGWTMIVPQLADFFLDHGGTEASRLCRLADELRCPAYEVDVRGADATTLFEADGRGQLLISGSSRPRVNGHRGAGEPPGVEVVGSAVRLGAVAVSDEIRDRIAALSGTVLADYLGALVGFPAWTRQGDEPIAAGALSYEPPHIVSRARSWVRSRSPETRGASARTTPRAVPPSRDRTGTRPRSASRPRR